MGRGPRHDAPPQIDEKPRVVPVSMAGQLKVEQMSHEQGAKYSGIGVWFATDRILDRIAMSGNKWWKNGGDGKCDHYNESEGETHNAPMPWFCLWR